MAIVVITGASSGIGQATARLLATQGHSLVLAARRRERLQQLTSELGRRTAVLAVPADLARAEDIEKLAQAAGERFGQIDVWINNAGVGGPSRPWWQADVQAIQQVVAVDLVAPLLSVRAAFPWLRRSGHGHIINVGSVAGHIGVSGPYSASKFGIRGLSESLRRELAPYGIRVSLLSPGFVRTEMTAGVPVNMPGPEVVARAIARLIRHPRREVVVPGWYRLPMLLNRLLPGLVDPALIWFHRHENAHGMDGREDGRTEGRTDGRTDRRKEERNSRRYGRA